MVTNSFQWKNYRVSAILKQVLKRFKKHYLVTTLVAIGCLFSTASVATNSLSDNDLVEVYAGGVDAKLEGQVLPQEQLQPGNNSSGYTLPQPLQNDDGMELSPELFTILQSSIDATRERKLVLSGETQQGAQGLNLNNSLSSDLVSTNNIFNGGSLSLEDVTTAIEVNQLNELHQLHRTQGNFNLSIAGFSYEEIVESRSGSESYDYLVYSSKYLQRQSSLLNTNYDYISAQVGSNFTSLDEFTSSLLPLTIKEPAPFGPKIFDLPEIGVSVLGTGASLDYTGIQLYGIGLVIESIDVGGNDLLLGTSITTPRLDFGEIIGEACFASICTDPTPLWDFGGIGGGEITPNFVLEDLAPKVKELNLGTGISFNGEAELIPSSGNLSINGEFYLRVTPYASLTLDLSKLVLLGVDVGDKVIGLELEQFKDDEGNYTDILTKTWSIDLVNEQLPFELLDEELVIDPIEIGFLDEDHFIEEQVLYRNIDDIEIYKFNDEADSSFSESYEHTIFTGGQMTGAQAELLALSEGILSVENNSNLSFSQSAQKNMRVLNGINAVSAVAANALNISRLPAASALSQISMQQRNIFIQQR